MIPKLLHLLFIAGFLFSGFLVFQNRFVPVARASDVGEYCADDSWCPPDDPGTDECCGGPSCSYFRCNLLTTYECNDNICEYGPFIPGTWHGNCSQSCQSGVCVNYPVCTPNSYEDPVCTTSNCGNAGDDYCVQTVRQCNCYGTGWGSPVPECTWDHSCGTCAASTPTPTPAPTPTPTPPPGVCENNCGGLGVCGFRKPDNSCTTDNSCCHRVCNASRVCVTEAGGGNNACDNNAGCVGPTPTPTPTPVPGCNTSALTIIPNPARVGDRMLFRYPPAQDQNLGIDTWNPSTSVSGCYRDVLANRQYICTAAQATSPTGTWTHKWNFGNCSKTATYTINPGYTPWIQVTGDVHSNVRIYAPGGP